MRIEIVGGGPAGLFFGKLVKQRHPDWRIRIFEQNPRDATYGFGVGLLGRSLNFMATIAPDLLQDILAASIPTSRMAFHHRGHAVPVDMGAEDRSVAIERLRLLNILQDHCERIGVELQFDCSVSDFEGLRSECDVLVGADGINSRLRETDREAFGTSVVPQKNKFAWYATDRVFDEASIIFERTEAGLVIAHAYQYRHDRSGFVIECDPETWERTGFGEMDAEQTVVKCEEIFARYLAGGRLLPGNLTWFTPSIVRNRHWSHGNMVLIGDAVRTVHPSIGSGTRVGMRDAAVLADSFDRHGSDIAAVFEDYRRTRQQSSDIFQRAALQSIKWYETIDERLHFDPTTMAFSYMLRTGAVDYARLRKSDPAFVRAYEQTPIPA